MKNIILTASIIALITMGAFAQGTSGVSLTVLQAQLGVAQAQQTLDVQQAALRAAQDAQRISTLQTQITAAQNAAQ